MIPADLWRLALNWLACNGLCAIRIDQRVVGNDISRRLGFPWHQLQRSPEEWLVFFS